MLVTVEFAVMFALCSCQLRCNGGVRSGVVVEWEWRVGWVSVMNWHAIFSTVRLLDMECG